MVANNIPVQQKNFGKGFPLSLKAWICTAEVNWNISSLQTTGRSGS